MKLIKLACGKLAKIDDIDYDIISKYKWSLVSGKYARAVVYDIGRGENGKLKQRIIKMHRLITGAKQEDVVDHINGDGLDNRRSNIRICDRTQNQGNRYVQKNSKSQIKGVEMRVRKSGVSWIAYIVKGCKKKSLGSYRDKNDAARAYNEAALEYFGDFAKLNVV